MHNRTFLEGCQFGLGKLLDPFACNDFSNFSGDTCSTHKMFALDSKLNISNLGAQK